MRPRFWWKEPFLKELRRTGDIKLACQLAGVSPQFVWKCRQKDEEFGIRVKVLCKRLNRPDWKEYFLRELHDCGVLERASRNANVGVSTVRWHRKRYSVFDEQVDMVLAEVKDRKILRRAR